MASTDSSRRGDSAFLRRTNAAGDVEDETPGYAEQAVGQPGVKGPDETWWPEDQDHDQRPAEDAYAAAEGKPKATAAGDLVAGTPGVKGPDPAVWG